MLLEHTHTTHTHTHGRGPILLKHTHTSWERAHAVKTHASTLFLHSSCCVLFFFFLGGGAVSYAMLQVLAGSLRRSLWWGKDRAAGQSHGGTALHGVALPTPGAQATARPARAGPLRGTGVARGRRDPVARLSRTDKVNNNNSPTHSELCVSVCVCFYSMGPLP